MSRGSTLMWMFGLLLCGLVSLVLMRSSPSEDEAPEDHGPELEELELATSVRVPVVAPSAPQPELSAQPRPDDPLVLANNRGAELLRAGQLSAALELFERCHRERPTSEVFRANLGEALVRSALEQHEARRAQRAIELLGRAVALQPEREPLAQLLQRWQREAAVELDFWSQGSDILELSYDVTRPDLLDSSGLVMDHLEAAYAELSLWFGVDPVHDLGLEKIRVVLYGQEGFDQLTGLGDWAGGVFDGVVRIAVGQHLEDRASWRRTMTHELAHAFIYALGGNGVPGWLNEGLAQRLEVRSPDLELARRRLGSTRFELDQLADSLATWTDKQAIAQAYAQSLLLVELILHEHGEEVLRRMVRGCKDGVDPAVSFEEYTFVSLESLLEFLR